MKLFSNDGSLAVIAVGDAPIGIFAAGQFARGFIAIGQVSIGVIALGQACVSIVGVGQVGIGVTWFAGMVGVGGRGLCLRLIPGIDPPRVAPEEIQFQSLMQGVPEGFVRAQVVDTANGARLARNGAPLPIKMTPVIATALTQMRATKKIDELYAHMKVARQTIVCDRLMEIPGTRRTYGLGFQIFRVLALCAVAAVWWYAFAVAKMDNS